MNKIENIKSRVIGVFSIIILLFISDIAEAQYGGARRRTRRRTAIVVSSATHAKDEQDAADAQAQAAKADTTKNDQVAPKTDPPKGSLPIGTIVTKLPDNCDSVVLNNVQYYHCENDYYRIAYQENNLVYVTTDPPI